jgi:hypothetical protein
MVASRGTIASMAAVTNWFTNDDPPSPATLDVVRDLVKRAEMKLSVLQSNRAQILRRLHALRYLATVTARPLKADADVSSISSPAIVRSGRMPSRANKRPDDLVRLSRSQASNLRRACRIALMESERAESSPQIYKRIAMRGSFSFESYSDPPKAIEQELKKMAEDDEVIGLGIGPTQRWEWKRE